MYKHKKYKYDNTMQSTLRCKTREKNKYDKRIKDKISCKLIAHMQKASHNENQRLNETMSMHRNQLAMCRKTTGSLASFHCILLIPNTILFC